MFITAETLDDLLRKVFEKILRSGCPVKASRGSNKEVCSALLRLTNPLARLSHTEERGRIFSALGELAWYMSGRNDVTSIAYYIKRYKQEAEVDGTVHGAYGPRMFGEGLAAQFDTVIGLLRAKPASRKAVIQLFDAADLQEDYKDVPCTCCLQFMIRGGRLNLLVTMRSNDAYYGLPHDVFCFTMLQELAARTLGCELGIYSHYAGSLHIYDEFLASARAYIDEGWQGRECAAMPPMPAGDPWPSVRLWLKSEAAVRRGRTPGQSHLARLSDYWKDLIRLLQVYRYAREHRRGAITRLTTEMVNQVYREYLIQKAKPKLTTPKSGQRALFPLEASNDEVETP